MPEPSASASTAKDGRAGTGKVTRGRAAIVGAFSPKTIAALADKGLPVPKTAEIALPDRLVVGPKQRRHTLQGNGLTESEWRQLPGVLQRAERVYIDTRSGKLIFVGDGADSATKIVVEFDPARQKKAVFNTIDTAFRVSAEDVEAAVKGKQWEPL
jgi:signal transduction histidine kinase